MRTNMVPEVAWHLPRPHFPLISQQDQVGPLVVEAPDPASCRHAGIHLSKITVRMPKHLVVVFPDNCVAIWQAMYTITSG